MFDPKNEDQSYLDHQAELNEKLYAKPAEVELQSYAAAEKEAKKTLEQAVVLTLLPMNRHDRRAWLARLNRKAGAQRDKALRAKMPAKKAERKAKANGTA